jgi:iron-regulated transporter 1
MSSTLRSIDLTTKLLAPIVTGQMIYFFNIGYGAVFVAGWNFISLFVEYAMIKKVYDQIPSLADQKFKSEEEDESKYMKNKEYHTVKTVLISNLKL